MTDNSYAAAGVDIAAGERAVDLMRAAVRATHTPDVVGGVGSFGGLYRAPGAAGQVLVSSTDGVGTKLKVASALGRHDTIGRDLVHHCIDDILTLGARPLFFLDYIGINSLVPETVAAIVGGLAAACRDHGVALIGGETAELPDLYAPGDYDLAGFIVGTVAEADIVDGRMVEAGDVVIGLPSDGLHTNGYSLARRVFADADLHAYAPDLGTSLGVELLRPHRCYLPEVAPWLGRGIVKAMAHITGGGLPGNLPRTLPEGLAAALDPTAWDVPPIFGLIEQRGGVPRAEMYRVFNMGIGYTITCAAPHAGELLAALPDAREIGRIVPLPGGSHDAEARVLGLA
jgi:phosphoribosylformylglycinamidine cyclo-ligase